MKWSARKTTSCCGIILFAAGFLFNTAPAHAKWWNIFHHKKKDTAEQEQLPPAAAPVYPAPNYVPTAGAPPVPSSVPHTLPLPTQAIAPSLEPPPLPARPPIPVPPPVACPAPLGSGMPKPVLAWRAKSIRQLPVVASANDTSVAAASGTAGALSLTHTPAPGAAAADGVSLSKMFPVKFDDAFMAAILACSRSGLVVHSMDSTQGRLEAIFSGPHSQIPVLVQLNHDLLDTTSVTCSCTSKSSKNLIGRFFAGLETYLNDRATITHAGGTALTSATSSGATTVLNARQPK